MNKLSAAVKDVEAKALSRLFVAHSGGITQAAFGKLHKLGTAGLVWQYLNGHRPLNIAAATKFAKALGVKIDEFSPRLSEEIRAAAEVVDLPTEAEKEEQRAAFEVTTLMKRAPTEDRQAWIAFTTYTLQRNAPLFTSEELARYDAVLNGLDDGDASRPKN